MIYLQDLDKLILKRLQQNPPKNCTVVAKSTPIIAFGKFRTAEVATISLNPSYKEFDIVHGKLRFHTLESLGVKSYSDINEEHLDKIIDYCENYFERSIVYRDWFDRITQFINTSTGKDYYDGTACHLDLSQWATEDVWDKLDKSQQKALLGTGDLELLGEIIKNGKFHTLYLNGKTASKEIFKYLGIKPKRVVLRKTIQTGASRKNKVEGYIAITNNIAGFELNRKIKIFGWNTYVKYASEEALNLISNWIKEENNN